MSDPSYTTHKNVPAPTSRSDGSFQYIVKVPVSIVGLLLVRRGTDSNILFQIRTLTNTYIVKHAEDDGGDTNSDRAQDKNDDSKADGNDEEESSDKPRRDPHAFETFAVRGKEDDVILASTCLARIVDGEKIYTVMYDLKAQRPAAFNHSHGGEDGSRYHGGRGRGAADGGRGRGGRGGGGYKVSRGGDNEDDGRWGHVRAPVAADDIDSTRARGGKKRSDGDDGSSIASGRSGGGRGRGRGSSGRGRGRGGRGSSTHTANASADGSGVLTSHPHRERTDASLRGGRGGRRGGSEGRESDHSEAVSTA
jgi:hypothetical protein